MKDRKKYGQWGLDAAVEDAAALDTTADGRYGGTFAGAPRCLRKFAECSREKSWQTVGEFARVVNFKRKKLVDAEKMFNDTPVFYSLVFQC